MKIMSFVHIVEKKFKQYSVEVLLNFYIFLPIVSPIKTLVSYPNAV